MPGVTLGQILAVGCNAIATAIIIVVLSLAARFKASVNCTACPASTE